MAVPEQQFKDILDHIEQLIKETIAKELQNLTLPAPAPTPAPSPNPLAFYETILKVESVIQYQNPTASPVRPYFADVYNDVVRYFGGTKLTDPLGQRFLEEAKKCFAYLDTAHKETIVFPTGVMARTIGKPGKFIDFDERDFAVLRQLLEDLYKDQAVDEHKKELIVLTKQLQKELETQQQQLRQELDKRQQKQAEQFTGIITTAFNAFRGELTQDITNIPPTTIKQLETKLATFREKLLRDIQAFIKTDKKEKDLDKAVTAMQEALETMQKTRGIHDNNSQQLPPPEDPTFQF